MSKTKITLAALMAATFATSALAQTDYTRVTEQNEAEFTMPDGWTVDELEDADLVDASGADLGDVEHVLADADGNVVAVMVELENPDDMQVVVELEGLETVTDGDDKDLQTTMTAEELAALPAYN